MANYTTEFVAANGTLLTASPLLWTVPPSGTSMQVQANRAVAVNSFTIRMLAPVTPANADYEAETDLVFRSIPASINGGIGVRMTSESTITGYFLRYIQSINAYRVDKIVAGTTTPLSPTSAAGTIAADAVRNLRLRAVGNKVQAWINDVQFLDYTDASPIAGAGQPGTITGGAASSSTTGLHFENFNSTDISSNTAPVANAGADQLGIEPGTTVSHTGSVSDAETFVGGTVAWAVQSTTPAGVPVTLITPTALTTTYEAPYTLGGVNITLSFTATDAGGLSHTDTVTDTVLYATKRAVTAAGQVPIKRMAV
jgi:hypothetical protein